MSHRGELANRFLDLHRPGTPLILPNPWDAGTAKLFASIGFQALATTSSGFAGTLGRVDGAVTLEESLDHAGSIAAATPLPVSADLENGFAHDPEGVAATVTAAAAAGLAGCSVEDYSGDPSQPLYEISLAAERIAAASEAAHAGEGLILTARAENHLRGRDDLGDTIARLQAFQEAGADVVYAPGLRDPDEIEQVVGSVDVPVNVLLLRDGPDVGQLAALGAARISTGGAFHALALAAISRSARELLEEGSHDFLAEAAEGAALRNRVFA